MIYSLQASWSLSVLLFWFDTDMGVVHRKHLSLWYTPGQCALSEIMDMIFVLGPVPDGTVCYLWLLLVSSTSRRLMQEDFCKWLFIASKICKARVLVFWEVVPTYLSSMCAQKRWLIQWQRINICRAWFVSEDVSGQKNNDFRLNRAEDSVQMEPRGWFEAVCKTI